MYQSKRKANKCKWPWHKAQENGTKGPNANSFQNSIKNHSIDELNRMKRLKFTSAPPSSERFLKIPTWWTDLKCDMFRLTGSRSCCRCHSCQTHGPEPCKPRFSPTPANSRIRLAVNPGPERVTQ